MLQLGCDLAQGYGIARPMPAALLADWVRSYRQPEAWREIACYHWEARNFPLLIMEVEHRRWVGRLLESVRRNEPALLPDDPGDSERCRFGHWLRGDGFVNYHGYREFRRIIESHAEVHRVGEQIGSSLLRGDHEGAMRRLITLEMARDRVLAHLNELKQQVVRQSTQPPPLTSSTQ
jgi:hypothetical protein